MVGEGCEKDENFEKNKYHFTSPHSNAFIDFDGDCLADLFMTVQVGSK